MGLKEIWEKVFFEQECGKYPAESLIRFTARNFYDKERAKIKLLEIGCGSGPNIWYFSREGFDAYGMDIAQTAIKRAQERLCSEGMSAKLSVGNIEKIPYKNDYFDGIVDNECLYCNDEKSTGIILDEVKRALKDGGYFFSRSFTDEMYTGKTHTKRGELEFTDVSDGPFASRGLARLIDRDGIERLYGSRFKIVSIDKIEYTVNDGQFKISEWIIICKK